MLVLCNGARDKGCFFRSLILGLPVFNGIRLTLVASHFTHNFKLLLSKNVSIISTVQIVRHVLNGGGIRGHFRVTMTRIRRNGGVTITLSRRGIFPAVLLRVVSINRGANDISGILLHSYSCFSRRTRESLATVASVVRPVVLNVVNTIMKLLFCTVCTPVLDIVRALWNNS